MSYRSSSRSSGSQSSPRSAPAAAGGVPSSINDIVVGAIKSHISDLLKNCVVSFISTPGYGLPVSVAVDELFRANAANCYYGMMRNRRAKDWAPIDALDELRSTAAAFRAQVKNSRTACGGFEFRSESIGALLPVVFSEQLVALSRCTSSAERLHYWCVAWLLVDLGAGRLLDSDVVHMDDELLATADLHDLEIADAASRLVRSTRHWVDSANADAASAASAVTDFDDNDCDDDEVTSPASVVRQSRRSRYAALLLSPQERAEAQAVKRADEVAKELAFLARVVAR
jgi:hypothetical protein